MNLQSLKIQYFSIQKKKFIDSGESNLIQVYDKIKT